MNLLDYSLVVNCGSLIVSQQTHFPGQLGVLTNIRHADGHHETLKTTDQVLGNNARRAGGVRRAESQAHCVGVITGAWCVGTLGDR